jgi:glycosyltransferase involved in cell wall biosynthesis
MTPLAGTRNVLFLTDAADLYGSDRCLLEVVARMGPGWKPYFAVPRPGRLTEALARANLPYSLLNLETGSSDGYSYKWKRLTIAAKLAALIRAHRIDLVHLNLHFQASIVAGTCALAGVPLIVHVRNIVDQPLGPLVHNVDGFICISEAVRNSLVDVGGIPGATVKERSWLIPDGRDLTPYDSGRGEHIRREFSFPVDAPVVGTVARICFLKAQDRFIEMAALISARSAF